MTAYRPQFLIRATDWRKYQNRSKIARILVDKLLAGDIQITSQDLLQEITNTDRMERHSLYLSKEIMQSLREYGESIDGCATLERGCNPSVLVRILFHKDVELTTDDLMKM